MSRRAKIPTLVSPSTVLKKYGASSIYHIYQWGPWGSRAFIEHN